MTLSWDHRRAVSIFVFLIEIFLNYAYLVINSFVVLKYERDRSSLTLSPELSTMLNIDFMIHIIHARASMSNPKRSMTRSIK